MRNVLQNLLKTNFQKCLVNVDGDPSQNYRAAWKVIVSSGVKRIIITPKTPDINPIESFLNFMSRNLQQDALEQNITYKIFEQFSERIMTSITSYPVREIDKIIEIRTKERK